VPSTPGGPERIIDGQLDHEVNRPWIVALPMYDFPELAATHEQLWSTLRRLLIAAGVADPPRHLTRGLHHEDLWVHPRLLLSQACEYPLAKSFADRVRLVATPRYAVTGCSGATYRSAIVVRQTDTADTLGDLRGRHCVINDRASNSGMNLLRGAVAAVAGGARFFDSVAVSGSHRDSALQVAGGAADVAAIDCVSWAHLQLLHPALVASLRVLAWTAASPSLPLVTAAGSDDRLLMALRRSLQALVEDRRMTAACERLFLTGFDLQPAGEFHEVLAIERAACQLGYPQLV
jgi:hypothetical protein